MKWFRILRDRLRALRQRETVINDIDREMRSHLELQVEANIRAGMSPAEARERALRSFGNVNRAVDAAPLIASFRKKADASRQRRRADNKSARCVSSKIAHKKI